MHTLIDFYMLVYDNFLNSLYQRTLVFFTPTNGLFLGYLFSALVIAIVFLALTSKNKNLLSVAKKAYKIHNINSQSAKDDVILFIFDKIFLGFIYSFILGVALFFRGEVINLLAFLELPTSHQEPGIFLSIILTLGSLLFFDFAVFIEHYISHKVLFLWEFHKIHHIAEELTPLTAYRTHPINQCCFILMTSLFSGSYSGVIGYFFDFAHAYILFAGQNVFMFILLLLGLNLQHSRVFICYPKRLSCILISPAYHQLHHSSDKKHHDINFGFIFSFWDKLFKTQLQPSNEDKLVFGVSGEKYESYAGIIKTYLVPFKRSFARIKRKLGSYCLWFYRQ